jgi:heat shock protein HslJ
MSVRGRSVWIVAVALLALVAVACSDDTGNDSTTSSTDDATSDTAKGGASSNAAFLGTNWVLTRVSSRSVRPGDITVTARFTTDPASGDAVSGDVACNGYTGPFERRGSSLTIGPDIVSTQVACVVPANSVARDYLGILPDVRSYAIDGDTLSLRNTGGTTLLAYRASGGADDLAGEWTVTSYYTGNAIQSVVGGVELTAVFDATTVAGSGGCNRFNGPVEITTTTLAIGPLASTLIGCTEPIATQEQQYLAALEFARTYTVSGDRLDLFRADGGYAVTFERSG